MPQSKEAGNPTATVTTDQGPVGPRHQPNYLFQGMLSSHGRRTGRGPTPDGFWRDGDCYFQTRFFPTTGVLFPASHGGWYRQ